MNEYNLLPDNEVTTVEDRVNLNPNLQTEQTNNFIDNLRSTQQSNNQQIQAQTQSLGTQVPSNLGGLAGGEGYWTSRYQTPQTNAATQNLRTAAQAAALNQALANEQAMWKKRYQEAYNAYQKRQNDKTNTTTPATPSTTQLETDINSDTPKTEVTLYDPEDAPFGKVTLGKDGSTRWTDPKSGEQYLLKSPTGLDELAIAGSFLGFNPTDGATQVLNGKTFVYDSATNMWYERGPLIFGGRVQKNG